MKYQNLSMLFEEKPEQFGTRGDFYFWEYLQEYFRCDIEMESKDEFVTSIKQQFELISGEPLKIDAMPYVEKFAHGGISSGVLCGELWLNRAIPLLIERFSTLEQQDNF